MDTNAVLRAAAAGNLTADETLTDFPMEPMTRPLYLHALVPAVSASDSLVITADFEDGSGNTLMQTSLPSISTAGLYSMPIFCDKEDLTDLSVILDVTLVGTAAGNFGAVQVWISTSPLS